MNLNVKWRYLIIIGFLFNILQIECFAGVEYQEIPGNTIIPLQQVDIRLVEKTVKVTNGKEFISMVFESMVFENFTNKEVVLQMGFPFSKNTELPDRDLQGKLIKKKIIVKIDGKEIPVVQTNIPEDIKKILANNKEISVVQTNIPENMKKTFARNKEALARNLEYVNAYSWQVSFKPKEKKTLDCMYYIQWGASINTPDGNSFSYMTKFGALWAGTIDKAKFSIKLDDRISELLKQKQVKLEIKPKGYRIINYQNVEWQFTNWEPTEDLSIIVWEK